MKLLVGTALALAGALLWAWQADRKRRRRRLKVVCHCSPPCHHTACVRARLAARVLGLSSQATLTAAHAQIGVIPARYQSARFPGKPLVPILGKAMVVRTWEQALKASTLSKVVVATDDDQIAQTCRAAGAEVVMTSHACPNGAGSSLACLSC